MNSRSEPSQAKSSAWTPWTAFAFKNDSVSRTHRLAMQLERPRRSVLRAALYSVFWPFKAVAIAAPAAVEFSRDPRQEARSGIAAFLVFWWLLVRHNMTIRSIIRYRMWRTQNFRRAREYIQHHEIIQIVPWLSRNKDTDALDNKVRFEKSCLANNLPCAMNVATLTSSGVTFIVGDALPQCDLFTKIEGRWGGSGGQIWRFDKEELNWTDGEISYDQDELLHRLSRADPDSLTIVQPFLNNAPEIAKFSSRALCTIRVVTVRLPGEHPRIFRAGLRMPVGAMQVDNLGAGGLAAGIDSDGRLTDAAKKAERYEYHTEHPDTLAKISGVKLEFWDNVVELALAAHKKLTDVYFVGWDIAWTLDGAKLIEANVGWGEDILQIPASRPLGAEFCELVEKIRKVEATSGVAK